MKIHRINLLMIVIFSLIAGCFGKSPQVLNNNYDKIQMKIIAVLPIKNKSDDGKISQLLRSKLLEELYFKGYSKLPLEMIDTKLASLHIISEKEGTSAIAPQALKDLLGADAGMYCTLIENNESKIFYAPIKIAVSCELRSTQNGEIIWNAQSESTKRNFDFTQKGLEKKSRDDFETVIDEVVNNIMKTLRDGPNLRG